MLVPSSVEEVASFFSSLEKKEVYNCLISSNNFSYDVVDSSTNKCEHDSSPIEFDY
jgi:hypothetical protein